MFDVDTGNIKFQSPKSGHYHCYMTDNPAGALYIGDFNPLNRVIIIVTIETLDGGVADIFKFQSPKSGHYHCYGQNGWLWII